MLFVALWAAGHLGLPLLLPGENLLAAYPTSRSRVAPGAPDRSRVWTAGEPARSAASRAR
jgi:hypothetical protein